MLVVDDRDVTVLQGDVLGCLGSLEDGSVDCVVTSPPYWGLRDYGTGSWEGGDASCDHLGPPMRTSASINANCGDGRDVKNAERREPMGASCSRCGAVRVDQQIGLEETPELFLERLVGVFREVRRVLADHGTCWVNMGDGYAAHGNGGGSPFDNGRNDGRTSYGSDGARGREKRLASVPVGLKPKDLIGMPWRLALALQADGWWLRSDIIWAKPNPMPESVTDRPTKSHEHVFLLSKQARYFYDADAVREPHHPDGRSVTRHSGPGEFSVQARSNGDRWPGEGRNMRDVWEIATQPFPGAHFATFPQKLVERCLKAGCRPGGTVLDPFLGSGTTAVVARRLGYRAVGIELNPEYCKIAAERLQQLSLLA